MKEERLFYTPEQVAEELQVSRRAVYKYLAEGRLHGAKFSERQWRISYEDLMDFYESEKRPGQQAEEENGNLPF